MERTDPQFKLRIPAEMKSRLEETSQESIRTLSNEILRRLDVTLELDAELADKPNGFEYAAATIRALRDENTALRNQLKVPNDLLPLFSAALALEAIYPGLMKSKQRDVLLAASRLVGTTSDDPEEIIRALSSRLKRFTIEKDFEL